MSEKSKNSLFNLENWKKLDVIVMTGAIALAAVGISAAAIGVAAAQGVEIGLKNSFLGGNKDKPSS